MSRGEPASRTCGQQIIASVYYCAACAYKRRLRPPPTSARLFLSVPFFFPSHSPFFRSFPFASPSVRPGARRAYEPSEMTMVARVPRHIMPLVYFYQRKCVVVRARIPAQPAPGKATQKEGALKRTRIRVFLVPAIVADTCTPVDKSNAFPVSFALATQLRMPDSGNA